MLALLGVLRQRKETSEGNQKPTLDLVAILTKSERALQIREGSLCNIIVNKMFGRENKS